MLSVGVNAPDTVHGYVNGNTSTFVSVLSWRITTGGSLQANSDRNKKESIR